MQNIMNFLQTDSMRALGLEVSYKPVYGNNEEGAPTAEQWKVDKTAYDEWWRWENLYCEDHEGDFPCEWSEEEFKKLYLLHDEAIKTPFWNLFGNRPSEEPMRATTLHALTIKEAWAKAEDMWREDGRYNWGEEELEKFLGLWGASPLPKWSIFPKG